MEYPIEGSHPPASAAVEIEKVKKIFYLDVHQLQTKNSSRLNSIFSTIDDYLICSKTSGNSERSRDLQKHYRDLPMPIQSLYKNTDYVKQRHGHDLQIKIDMNVTNKKKRRQITMVKDSFGIEEESIFQKLHAAFTQISQEFGGTKSIFEITDIFMRVSGDIQAVRDYLNGKRVVEWQYLEDIALSHPESSTEYRCLIATKGRDEVDKRKRFLLSTQVNSIASGQNNNNGANQIKDESNMDLS
eukprot:403374436